MAASIRVQGCLKWKSLLRAAVGVRSNEFEIAKLAATKQSSDFLDVLPCVLIHARYDLRIARFRECWNFRQHSIAKRAGYGLHAAVKRCRGARNDTGLGEQCQHLSQCLMISLTGCKHVKSSQERSLFYQ